MKKLLIIGAGGHGRVAADTAKRCGYTKIAFLDDSYPNSASDSIIGNTADIHLHKNNCDFFVAVGNIAARRKITNMLREAGITPVTLIHPNATIGENVTIGNGSIVMPGAVINTGAVLCESVIVNTCASVDHDCSVGNYSHISVGAHIAGTVSIGEDVFICAGATVINNVSICDSCIIAAGAVVISDISEAGTYMGIPAQRSK